MIMMPHGWPWSSLQLTGWADFWHPTGRAEREVVAAAEGADLLICTRDGDRARLGPRSLGPASRFIVDHAPCPVLLVWPEPAPSVATIPPPPPHPPHHR